MTHMWKCLQIYCNIYPLQGMQEDRRKKTLRKPVGFMYDQFDVWPWKTIGHLFIATSSFVHHFVAIGELKLELQSGNAQ